MTTDAADHQTTPPHPVAVAVHLRALYAEFTDLLARDRTGPPWSGRSLADYFHPRGLVANLLDGVDVSEPSLAALLEDVFDEIASEGGFLRRQAAGHPHVPPRLRTALAADPDPHVRASLARGLPCDHPMLTELAADDDPRVAMAALVAGLPAEGRPVDVGTTVDLAQFDAELNQIRVDDALADVLLAHPDARVRLRALPRPQSGMFQASDHGGEVATRAAVTLAGDADATVRAGAAAHPPLPADVLERLAGDPDPAVRAAVAGRQHGPYDRRVTRTPPTVQSDLAGDPDPAVRAALADSSDTPAPLLAALAADPDSTVRKQVLINPAAGTAALAAVALADPDMTASAVTRQRWDGHAVWQGLTDAAKGQLRTQLEALLPHRDTNIRKAAGATLAAWPGPDTLATLAADATAAVRAVAAASPHLPADLELTLAADATKTVRTAVARRLKTISDQQQRRRVETVLAMASDWTGTAEELVAAATALSPDGPDNRRPATPTPAPAAPTPRQPEPAVVRRVLADAVLGERFGLPGPDLAWVFDDFADAGDTSVLELLHPRPGGVAAAHPAVVTALARFDHPLGREAAAVVAVADGRVDGIAAAELAAVAAGPCGAGKDAAAALLATGDPAVARALLGNDQASVTVRRAAWVVTTDAVTDARKQLDELRDRDWWRRRTGNLNAELAEDRHADRYQLAADRVLLDQQTDATVAWWLGDPCPQVVALLGRDVPAARRTSSAMLGALVAADRLPSPEPTSRLLDALLDSHEQTMTERAGRSERIRKYVIRHHVEQLGALALLHGRSGRPLPALLTERVVAATPVLLDIAGDLSRSTHDGLSVELQRHSVAALRGALPVLDGGTVAVLSDTVATALTDAAPSAYRPIGRRSAPTPALPVGHPARPLLDELADRVAEDPARLRSLAPLGSDAAAAHLREHDRRRDDPDPPATIADALGALGRRSFGPQADAALQMLAGRLDDAAAELTAWLRAAHHVSELENLVDTVVRLAQATGDRGGSGQPVPPGPLRDVLLAFPAQHLARRTPAQGYKPWWPKITAVLRDEVGNDPATWTRLAAAIAVADGQQDAGTVGDLLAAARA